MPTLAIGDDPRLCRRAGGRCRGGACSPCGCWRVWNCHTVVISEPEPTTSLIDSSIPLNEVGKRDAKFGSKLAAVIAIYSLVVAGAGVDNSSLNR